MTPVNKAPIVAEISIWETRRFQLFAHRAWKSGEDLIRL